MARFHLWAAESMLAQPHLTISKSYKATVVALLKKGNAPPDISEIVKAGDRQKARSELLEYLQARPEKPDPPSNPAEPPDNALNALNVNDAVARVGEVEVTSTLNRWLANERERRRPRKTLIDAIEDRLTQIGGKQDDRA